MTVQNGTRTAEGRFRPGNPGRPKGSKNKLSKEQALSATAYFEPLLEPVRDIMGRHLAAHAKSGKDCATCRHYVTLTVEYSFGRPTQRHEVVDREEVREEARLMARELGLDEEELMQEADRILALSKSKL